MKTPDRETVESFIDRIFIFEGSRVEVKMSFTNPLGGKKNAG